MNVPGLFLCLIVGGSTDGSPISMKPQSEKPPVSGYNSSAVREFYVDKPGIDEQGSKAKRCDDPKGYSVEEGTDSGINSVRIVRGGTVLHTVKLPTNEERNGFGFNWVKKTKEGFEIAIEYGSRFYYAKRFNFVCRHHKFYLNKIRVDSFDRHNPEKWNRKVIRVQPNVPLEKFSITNFMLEGVAQDRTLLNSEAPHMRVMPRTV